MESLSSQITNKSIGLEIVKFVDNRDLLNLELVNKQFKIILNSFYFNQTNLLQKDSNQKIDSIINNASSNKESLNKYKRLFYKTYLDSFIPFNISDKKFDTMIEINENPSQEIPENLKQTQNKSNKKEKKENQTVVNDTISLDKSIFSK